MNSGLRKTIPGREPTAKERQQSASLDRAMMARCIALSIESGEQGEYPYGVVIWRSDELVAEATNRVAHEHHVTRHAEVVAISHAQKALQTTSLDDCTIYVNAEPCAFCSYAIRESRIGRVVYGLRSPHMGWRVEMECAGRRRFVKRNTGNVCATT